MTTSFDHIGQALEALSDGNHSQAFHLARESLKQGSTTYDALLVLATEAIYREDLDTAARLCAQARRAGSSGGWQLALEGRLALASGNLEQGKERVRKAAVAGAEDAHVANEIGVLLCRIGLYQPALAYFRFATQDRPKRADFRYNYATTLQATGAISEAKDSFRQAAEANPELSAAWLALSKLEKNPKDEWIAQLELAFDKASDSEERIVLGHALAHMTEAQEKWELSLDWLHRAKLAKAQEFTYDRAETDRVFAAARDAASIPVDPNVANERNVLFVAGLPRSGTTLVQRVLDSHPMLHSRGELRDWTLALRKAYGVDGLNSLDADLIAWSAAEADLAAVGDQYLRSVHGDVAKAGLQIIDKTPFNIFHAPAILRALPGARIICLRRSPFDVLFGIYRNMFAVGFEDYFFTLDFDENLHFVARFEEMADRFAQALPPERFITVQYEDVVADLEGQARRFIDFTGLDWDPACIDFHANPRPSATASSAQVREPIYSSAIGRWRRYGAGAARAIDGLARYGIHPQST